MSDTNATTFTWQLADEIASLLQKAAEELWRAGADEGIGSPSNSLGLDAFTAAGGLVPVDEAHWDTRDAESGGLRPILERARHLVDQLDPQLVEARALTVAVPDLYRMVRASAT